MSESSITGHFLKKIKRYIIRHLKLMFYYDFECNTVVKARQTELSISETAHLWSLQRMVQKKRKLSVGLLMSDWFKMTERKD